MKQIFAKILLSNFMGMMIFSIHGEDNTALNNKISKSESVAVFLINTTGHDESTSAGTGFACLYKGKEFIATNLHVIHNAKNIEFKSQSGAKLRLQNKIIACEDADIALIPIEQTFSELKVKPFEFASNVFEETKPGDDITCLGNSLGNGVINASIGKIKAFGEPLIEIDCPVVQGNSGGPIIHNKSGKVIGLVTEATINKLSFDELGLTASKSKDSTVSEISYFGHRIDTAKKWTAKPMSEFINNIKTIYNANLGLKHAALFMCDKQGWEEDRRLTEAWDAYNKFIQQAEARNTKRLEVTEYVNDLGVVVRRDTKIKGLSVAQADFDKAYATFKRAVEWKVLADKEALEKIKPIGYTQALTKKISLDFSSQLIQMSKEL